MSLPAPLEAATRAPTDPTPLPLGIVTLVPKTPSCLAGYTCTQLKISGCSNVSQSIKSTLAQSWPSGPPRGVLLFLSGSGGTSWWNTRRTTLAGTFLADLRDVQGFVIVQLKWAKDWTMAASGQRTGLAHLACRPATMVKYVYDTIYAPLGITPTLGTCGYCLTGNSGGASQATYPLSHYGLDSIINATVPTSGPTHAAMARGCLLVPGYEYSNDPSGLDYPYGYLDPINDPGPCIRHDDSWTPNWDADSVDTQGSDYSYSTSRVEILIGGQDIFPETDNHAADYRDRLLQDPANNVTWTFVTTMEHHIQRSQSGLDALKAALLRSW
jgi:hypothetical protein